MKKIFALLAILIAALAFCFTAKAEYLTYDMNPEPGKVKFKVTVKDYYTSEPVPNGHVDIRLVTGNGSDNIKVLANGASNIEGVIYFVANYTSGGNFTAVNNQVAYYNNSTSRFDFNPRGDYNFVIGTYPASDLKIRNYLSGQHSEAHGGAHSHNAGGNRFDDAALSAGWESTGATIEMEIFLINNQNNTHYNVYFDTSEIGNAGSYNTMTVTNNGLVTKPADPEYINMTKVFDHWEYNGHEFDFNNYRVHHNIGLRPVFVDSTTQIDEGAQGIIHYKVYMWDHDGYNTAPRVPLSQNYSNSITGPNTGITVPSNYTLAQYQNNPGWTEFPIKGLRFHLRTYANTAGAHPEAQPLGLSGTYPDNWWTSSDYDYSYSSMATDAQGESVYIIPRDSLVNLRTGYVIDTDPDSKCVASLYRSEDIGREYCTFNYDWLAINTVYGQNGGLVGVRYIKEGPRHDDSKEIHLGSFNDNDAFLITKDDIIHGFEFTFCIYLIPAPSALFDVNGGSMPSGTSSDLYPVQRFDPVNSAGVTIRPWIVQNPGTPTLSGKRFAGWHEIRTSMQGVEYEDPNVFDFTREISYSVSLRAEYVDQAWTVRWAPENWDGNSDAVLYEKYDDVENGTLPSYNQELPTKENSTFLGWDLYVLDENGDRNFGSLENYRFVKTVLQPVSSTDTGDNYMEYIETTAMSDDFWVSPVAVDNGDQIYIAKFENVTTLTVSKSGMSNGDSAIFTITKGEETRTIVLTGNAAGTAVSETLMLTAGNWTVTENTSWSWAYDNTNPSEVVSLANGENKTVSFSNTPKSSTPDHAEANVVNTFANYEND